MPLTLAKLDSEFVDPARQVALLEADNGMPRFQDLLHREGLPGLTAERLDVLQINVGKLCNQTCSHCHVDAGPHRRELMTRETMEACLRMVRLAHVQTVDITGGAPEMNPHFRWFVQQLRSLGCRVLDRCNLTILTVAGYADLAEFLAQHHVHVVASLPCYLEENTDRQRGDGVFRRSIQGLQKLNACGYGDSNSGLELVLVFNPVGTSLPPNQSELEQAYRDQLLERFGIRFNRLFTVTNMPISRFLEDLIRQGRYESYMETLVQAFNSQTVTGLMCRNTLSVDWQGNLFDCDFNQMLDLHLHGIPRNVNEVTGANVQDVIAREIQTGRHCFGCTAGAGSSCQGAIAELKT